MNKTRFFITFVLITLIINWVTPISNYNIKDNYIDLKHQLKPKSSGLFNSNITTDKDNYSIFEDIITIINYTSPLVGGDYFTYAFSSVPNDFSRIIYESEPKTDYGELSEQYRFHISDFNLDIPGEGKYYYILLLYYGAPIGWPNFVCERKMVYIEKETLVCTLNKNNTIIDYGESISFEFHFFSAQNNSYFLVNSTIYCEIRYNNTIITESFIELTNDTGQINIFFRSEDYNRVGYFIIHIINNSNHFFKQSSFYCNLTVNPKLIGIKLKENIPYFMYVNRFNNSVYYPIKIDIISNNSIYYDPLIIPKILFYSQYYNFTDFYNGTYFCLLVLDNIEQNQTIEILIDSLCYFANSISAVLNVTKRNLTINCLFSEEFNYSIDSDLYLFFEIIDNQDLSYNIYLSDNIYINYYCDGDWYVFDITPNIYNQSYYFNLTTEYLVNLNNTVKGDLLFKLCFNGNDVYYSANSSTFIAIMQLLPEGKGQSNPNVNSFSFNILTTLAIIISSSVLSIMGFYGVKFFSKKIKKTYPLKELKI